jgi:hypothetical protein
VTAIQKGYLASPALIIEVECNKSAIRTVEPVEKIKMAEMSGMTKDWEKTHQDELRKLIALGKKRNVGLAVENAVLQKL